MFEKDKKGQRKKRGWGSGGCIKSNFKRNVCYFFVSFKTIYHSVDVTLWCIAFLVLMSITARTIIVELTLLKYMEQ